MGISVDAGLTSALYEELSRARGVPIEYELTEIILSDEALAGIGAIVTARGMPTEVLIIQDRTTIYRAGEQIKQTVPEDLARHGLRVESVTLPGSHPQTTRENIALVRARLREGQVVIVLGSGTATDIAKQAVWEFEGATGTRAHLVVVQTANSVCAYTSRMSVLSLEGGVKRTVPSRLPDVLVLDTVLLGDAPSELTWGGVGDASVAASSFADYRLSALLGFATWEPLSWELMEEPRQRFLRGYPNRQELDRPSRADWRSISVLAGFQ